MATIFTTQIVNAFFGAPSSNVVFTVPAQRLLIVTDIDTFVLNPASGLNSIVFIGSGALLNHTSTAVETLTQQWTGKQALNAGQSIDWNFAGSSSRIAITGYLLVVDP